MRRCGYPIRVPSVGCTPRYWHTRPCRRVITDGTPACHHHIEYFADELPRKVTLAATDANRTP